MTDPNISPVAFELVLADFIRKGDTKGVTSLLASLPPPRVQELLQQGVVARGQPSSFIEACLYHKQHTLLADVLRNLPNGLTPADFTKCHQVQGGYGAVVEKSLHLAAVENADPFALELAIELDTNHVDLTRMHKSGQRREDIQTLHFMAIYNAVGRSDTADYLRGLADCARVLRDHGAPLRCVSEHRGEMPSAADAFFGRPWSSFAETEMLNLLVEYVDIGLVDVDLPSQYTVGPSDFHYTSDGSAATPLATVIRQGNAPAAGVLIELGADTGKALPEASPEIRDIFALVRMHTHIPEVEARLRASITHALMKRRLANSTEAAPETPPAAPPAPRRQRRIV